MFLLLSSLFSFIGTISNEDNSNSLCNDFPNIECKKYISVHVNLTYINQRIIHPNNFSYKSTADNNLYPLSNAFDFNDTKSYWAASTPNNETFYNSIIIKFVKTFTIESILYKASFFNLINNTRKFNGFPTKLRIYTSNDNEKLQHEYVFVGTPENEYENYQFLPKPTLIDKIKLEFVEVTSDELTSNGLYTPVSCGIAFLQNFSENLHDESTNVKQKMLADEITGTCGDGVSYSFVDGNLSIFGNGEMSNSSPFNSFKSRITTIVIMDGVTSIGNNAFSNCNRLISITIPSSVKSIGNFAFSSCSGSYSITIPDGLISISNCAFYFSSGLTSIAISYSVTSIGEEVFMKCSSLQSINVDSNNNYYKSEDGVLFTKNGLTLLVFPCGRLDNPYIIPDGVKSIDKNSFLYSNLISIIIPDSITTFNGNPFRFCDSLQLINVDQNNKYYKSKDGILFTKDGLTLIQYSRAKTNKFYRIPDGVTSIGEYAFSSCSSLISLNISSSVKSIGQDAFSYCIDLKSIEMSDSVTSIDNRAFYRCTSLTSITIPSSVISIGEDLFQACYKLQSIDVDPNNNYYKSKDGVLFTKNGLTLLIFPCGRSDNPYIIPDGVKSLGKESFLYSNLISIIIPDSVTSIGDMAFLGAEQLSFLFYKGKDPPKFGYNILYNTNKLDYVSVFNNYKGADFGGKSVKIIFTRYFTESNEFSNSNRFTFSNDFSYSYQFTFSNNFSYSDKFSISKDFSDSFLFSKSKHFSESSIFSKSHYFSESSIFSKSDTFIPKKDGHSITITHLMSFSLTYLIRKSVSFSISFIISNINIKSYTEDLASHIDVFTQSYVHQYYPYVIQYLSPSYVKTYFPIVLELKKKISPENLIGVVCGATAIFFFIIGIIILIIKKKKFDEHESNDFYDISESDDSTQYQTNLNY